MRINWLAHRMLNHPKRLVLCCISFLTASMMVLIPIRTSAQTVGRVATLTFTLDFASSLAEVQGTVQPAELSADAAQLSDWGSWKELVVWKSDQESKSEPWSLKGVLDGVKIVPPGSEEYEDEYYHLKIGPLRLAPGDRLIMQVPFVNLILEGINPPPQNLDRLLESNYSVPRSLDYLAPDEARLLTINIPFTTMRQDITLELTPLIGEVFMGRTDSFRLSGEVEFGGLDDYLELERHCVMTEYDAFFRYREVHTLFMLDYPPALNLGFLNSAYQFKPTYSLLRSDLIRCEYQAGQGLVSANFTGRVFNRSTDYEHFPIFLEEGEVIEQNVELRGQQGSRGEFEIILGEILLGPEDVLTVSIPYTNILQVQPPPDHYLRDDEVQTLIEYRGPQRFALSLRYSPKTQLLVRQLPAIARSAFSPIEDRLTRKFDQRVGVEAMTTLIIGVSLLILSFRWRNPLTEKLNLVGLFLVGLSAFYSIRGVHGWLLFASLLIFIKRIKGSRQSILKGLGVIFLVFISLLVDAGADEIFFKLSPLELEITPITPFILSVSLFLIVLLIFKGEEASKVFTKENGLPFTLFLFSLSVYDILQKSLPAVILIGIGGALLIYRNGGPSRAGQVIMMGALERFKRVWNGGFIPRGVVLIAAFAALNGLQTTDTLLGPGLGILGIVLIPVLVFVSILLTFVAIGALFVLLYPALPFNQAFAKALLFGVFLCLVFLAGVGSDNRLVTSLDELLIGRVVFYLSIPLLISLFYDAIPTVIKKDGQEEKDVEETQPSGTPWEAMRKTLAKLQGNLGTLRSLVSIIAPAAYAAFLEKPIISSYFELLDTLIKFSEIPIG